MFRKLSKLAALAWLFMSPGFSSITIFIVPMFMNQGAYIPILGRLRAKTPKNKRIQELMEKIQKESSKDAKDRKNPLNNNEMKEVQSAIEECYKDSIKEITEKLQAVSDKYKCIISFKADSDIQIVQGVSLPIELTITPNDKVLDKGEKETEKDQVARYKNAYAEGQEAVRKTFENWFKQAGMLDGDGGPSKKARIGGA